MSYYPFPGGQRDGMVSKKMHFLSETTIPYSHLSILPDAVFFCHAAVPRTRDGNFLIQSLFLFFLLRRGRSCPRRQELSPLFFLSPGRCHYQKFPFPHGVSIGRGTVFLPMFFEFYKIFWESVDENKDISYNKQKLQKGGRTNGIVFYIFTA